MWHFIEGCIKKRYLGCRYGLSDGCCYSNLPLRPLLERRLDESDKSKMPPPARTNPNCRRQPDGVQCGPSGWRKGLLGHPTRDKVSMVQKERKKKRRRGRRGEYISRRGECTGLLGASVIAQATSNVIDSSRHQHARDQRCLFTINSITW